MKLLVSFATALLTLPLAAQSNLMWNQTVDGYAAVPSSLQTAPALDVEAADDFDTAGLVERVIIQGYACFGCGGGLALDGVRVRFYAWNAGAPGALQHEAFVAGDDPAFRWNANYPDVLDVTLPDPFLASGRHFVSAQLVTPGSNGWAWWSANRNDIVASRLHVRDNLASGSWEPYVPFPTAPPLDLAFQLWGQGPAVPPPPRMLYSQNPTITDLRTVASGTWPGNELEAADDFELDARITKVVFSAYVQYLAPYPDAIGARMRFYEGSGAAPGALLYDTFATADSPVFEYGPTVLHFELPEPLEVHGKVFVSVQLAATNVNGWGWRVAAGQTHDGAVVRTGAGEWLPLDLGTGPLDLALTVYGSDLTPPPVLGEDPCGDWQTMEVPLPAGALRSIARDLVVLGEDDVWAVGDKQVELGFLDQETYPAAWHFDGTEWSEIPTPAPEPYTGAGSVFLWAVDGVAGDDVWAGGTRLRVDGAGFVGSQTMALHWDGSEWTLFDTPVTPSGASGAQIYGIEAIASDDVWFVGGWVLPSGCDMALALHWDGSSFTVIDTPCAGITPLNVQGFELEAVDAVASDDVWAVGGGRDGDYTVVSYILHWDGASWSHVPAPAPGTYHRLRDVEALSADDVWAVGDYYQNEGYHAFALHWDGASWTLFDGQEFPLGSAALHGFASDDVYAAGSGIAHWDGTSWSWVEDFGQQQGHTLGVSCAALDGVDPCELWTAGRHLIAGQILPFSARQVSNQFWATVRENGCHDSAPAQSLEPVEPPRLGANCTVALGDPLGETGIAGGAALWLVSSAPSLDPDCGQPLAGLGKDGGTGHLLVRTGALRLALYSGASWTGGGAPGSYSVAIPPDPAYVGQRAFTQGLLLGGGRRVLTRALELQVGF